MSPDGWLWSREPNVLSILPWNLYTRPRDEVWIEFWLPGRLAYARLRVINGVQVLEVVFDCSGVFPQPSIIRKTLTNNAFFPKSDSHQGINVGHIGMTTKSMYEELDYPAKQGGNFPDHRADSHTNHV